MSSTKCASQGAHFASAEWAERTAWADPLVGKSSLTCWHDTCSVISSKFDTLDTEDDMERLISLRNTRHFRTELHRYEQSGRLVHWYTTDHHYVLVLRRVK